MSIFSSFLASVKIPCIFPFYHGVAPISPPHIHYLYPLPSPEKFERDLEYLLTHFSPISLKKVLELPRSGYTPPKPYFHLSFDDGLSSCYGPIRSILLKKGIPATFFLNSGFVGNKALFYRYKISVICDVFYTQAPDSQEVHRLIKLLQGRNIAIEKLPLGLKNISYHQSDLLDEIASVLGIDFADYLQREQPYMTVSQIQELVKDGFTLGGHSIDHPLYSDLPPEAQLRQSLESVVYVKQTFGIPYSVFAFPFTDQGVPKQVFEGLYEAGVQASFGTAGLKKDEFPQHFQRIPMEKWPYQARYILGKECGVYLPKLMMGKNRTSRT